MGKSRIALGHRLADKVTRIVGSWTFIVVQSSVLFVWAILNIISWEYKWDPYPFILMNLFLSLQAAYTAPIIMISQNRLSAMDREELHKTFLIGTKERQDVQIVLDYLEEQDQIMFSIKKEVEKIKEKVVGEEDAKH